MAELLSAHGTLQRVLGAGFEQRLVFPTIARDARNASLPLVLRLGESMRVILHESDRGAEQRLTRDGLYVEFFGDYFTWDSDAAPKADLGRVVADLVDAPELTIEPTLPAAHYQALSSHLRLGCESSMAARPVNAFAVSRRSIEVEMRRDYARFIDPASRQIEPLRYGAELSRLLRNPDPGFELLDSLLGSSDLDALLVTSPFQVEEVTGVPEGLAARHGVSALVRLNDESTLLLVEGQWEPPRSTKIGKFDSLATATRSLCGPASIGVEEVHIPWVLVADLERRSLVPDNATSLIRSWQDRRSGGNLAYYVLAAHSALAGLEKAMSYANAESSAGNTFTEQELARVYTLGVADFALDVGLPTSIRPYFHVIHAGERTLFPATPTDHELSGATETIKLDVGTQVLDREGRVRACSDLARTITSSRELTELHEILRHTLVDDVIAGLRTGMRGHEVHASAIRVLKPHEERFKTGGMMPASVGVEGYRRDCGHSLNRQGPASVRFIPGRFETLKEHMVGCAEFVWPYDGNVIAVEEAFLMSEGCGIPITV